jgi:hypothetical protein
MGWTWPSLGVGVWLGVEALLFPKMGNGSTFELSRSRIVLIFGLPEINLLAVG